MRRGKKERTNKSTKKKRRQERLTPDSNALHAVKFKEGREEGTGKGQHKYRCATRPGSVSLVYWEVLGLGAVEVVYVGGND